MFVISSWKSDTEMELIWSQLRNLTELGSEELALRGSHEGGVAILRGSQWKDITPG